MQNYNLIIDIKDIAAGSPGISEPVSVSEFKNYSRLESFEDDLGSTANIANTTDDDLIEDLLVSAREDLEAFTGRAFIPKEIRVTVTNLAGMQELPCPPIGDMSALYYGWDFEEDGESAENNIADLVLSGSERKHIVSPCDERIVIDYSCGYGRGDTPRLPRRLKMAILVEALYRYEHRGEELEDTGICKAARQLAAKFCVKPIIT